MVRRPSCQCGGGSSRASSSTAEQCPQTPALAGGRDLAGDHHPWAPIPMYHRGKSTNPRQQKVKRWSFIGQGRNSKLEGEKEGVPPVSKPWGGGAVLRPGSVHGERDDLAWVAQSAES